MNIVVLIGFVPMLLLLGLSGHLLPTWMFLNSLQLIVHAPMLATNMPANLHHFLVDYLSLIRLDSKKISSQVEIWERELGLANYKLITGEDSF